MIDVNKQQSKFEKYAEIYRKETNEVFRELVRQLILVATVFLSISLFVFSNKELLNLISLFDKHILSFSWILFVLSILLGICQFVADYLYFRRWVKVKFDIAEKMYLGKVGEKDIYEEIIKPQRDIPAESSTIFVYLQIAALSVGAIILVGIMIKTLFVI